MAVLVLVAAVGVGVLIGRAPSLPSRVKGWPETVVTAIDGSLAALNRGDLDAFAAYWTKYAVFEDASLATVARGVRSSSDLNEGLFGVGARYYRTSAVIQRGNLAAYVVSCPVPRGMERHRSRPVRWGLEDRPPVDGENGRADTESLSGS